MSWDEPHIHRTGENEAVFDLEMQPGNDDWIQFTTLEELPSELIIGRPLSPESDISCISRQTEQAVCSHSQSPAPRTLDTQHPGVESWSDLDPLQRWRNSPPEIEPASLQAIINAVANGRESSNSSPGSFNPLPPDQPDARSQTSSNHVGRARSSSSGSSAYSFSSNNSQGSFHRFYVNGGAGRRRRRRQSKPTTSLSTPRKTTTEDKRPYQCTFCTDTFRAKYDWTRHEKTLHLSLERFTCGPSGSTYLDPADGTERCVFCAEPHPSETHIESHNFNRCQEKPTSFRTFYRKDHLTQHLRLVHGVSRFMPAMEGWKSQVNNIRSRCGFCDESFELWTERNDHLARHFRKGALMKDWRGPRGLDTSTAVAVENSMPPYLIGAESKGIEPFSASRLPRQDNCPKSQMETGELSTRPTPFEYLTSRLASFVDEVHALNGTVTDEMLQREARCVMYGDDDPWNQTAADNPEWLKLFKEGMGLVSTGEQSSLPLPFSQGPLEPDIFAVDDIPANLFDTAVHPSTAWSLQSPECLAEYRQGRPGVCPFGGLEKQGRDIVTEPLSFM